MRRFHEARTPSSPVIIIIIWVASQAGQSRVFDDDGDELCRTMMMNFAQAGVDCQLPRPTTSETTQRRRLHLLRIPNHGFAYSVLPPLESYFAQDDHVPRQVAQDIAHPHCTG
jgi:hypothetical protein